MKKSFQKIMLAVFLITAHTLAICAMGEDGSTIKDAVINGHNDVLIDIFNNGGVDAQGCHINSVYEHDYTALHLAVLFNRESTIFILLVNGAAINAVDQDQNTPLHLAILYNRSKMAQFLILCNADLGLENSDGKTASSLAGEKEDSVTLFNIAQQAYRSYEEIMNNICDQTKIALINNQSVNTQGCQIHSTYEHGYTALHLAALYGYENTALILVANGADVNAVDEHQNTPLHLAILHNRSRVVQFLIEYGAHFNLKNSDNKTALDLATEKEDADTILSIANKLYLLYQPR